MSKLSFASDYMKSAHPRILARMMETAAEGFDGYGLDPVSESARAKIRQACDAPNAYIHFMVGGTQANATVIDALLRNYQGVLAAVTGHIAVHEAGAVEFGGHKVLTLPSHDGKVAAEDLRQYLEAFYADPTFDHMVIPGMLYISQPTENGTLYSKEDLEALRKVCQDHHLPLYIDGARLAYALACPQNDVDLPELARLADVFYIGGTKCGALFGEAVVIPDPSILPHFFTTVKQHGGLLAKGWMAGLQFDTLFTDNLYMEIGKSALTKAERLRDTFSELGWEFHFDSPTNQIFVVVENGILDRIKDQVAFSVWEPVDDSHTAVRFATSWSTTDEEVDALISLLTSL